ncbi:MAG TPA: DUF4184 family protein, partial [Micromonospora sp.]
MPLTFPSHAAAALALKLWRPAWFDGVALVAGTVAPDVVYLAAARFSADTHSLPGLLWWCLPVAWAYTWLFRRTVAGVAANLPAGGRFGWSGYARLAGVRHPPLVTAGSALLGAVTHVGWDWLTHTDGWLRTLSGVDFHAATGVHWWTVSDLSSTALGGLAAVALAVPVGRWLAADGRARPDAPRRPALFWTVAAAVAVAGAALVAVLPG